MNILFISTNYPYPADDGHNLRTLNILKCLARNHRVFYFAFSKNKEPAAPNDPVREMCEFVRIFFAADDFSKMRFTVSLCLNIFSRYPYVAQKYYRRELEQEIGQIQRLYKIDLVHLDLLPLARYGRHLGGDIPRALTEHNVESKRVLRLARNSRNPLLKGYLYLQYAKLRAFEKKEIGRCEICITVSEEDAQLLQKMVPTGRFFVVPNGVDTDFFKPGDGIPDPNTLIWTGGMSDLYNKEAMDYFARGIWPIIDRQVDGVKFLVVGKNPTDSVLKISRGNRNVKVLGYVDDVRPHMDQAAIFVAPIKSGGGTKLKVLNAMAMGKAVVTTRVGAEGIKATNGRHIVIADGPREFAEAVIDLMRRPSAARAMSEKARELVVSHYSWTTIGAEQNRIYQQVINETNA